MIDNTQHQYALDESKNLVSIFDVPNGKACNCVCTKCKKRLGARNKGKERDKPLKEGQKAAHFYHLVQKKCFGETLVHILAKQIIQEKKMIEFKIPIVDELGFFIKNEIRKVEFDDVFLEKKLDLDIEKFIVPDITAIAKENRKKILFIEIVYTNKISTRKRKLIKKENLNFLAINFNVPTVDWKISMKKEQLKEKIEWFLYDSDERFFEWVNNQKFIDNQPKKVIENSSQNLDSNFDDLQNDYQNEIGLNFNSNFVALKSKSKIQSIANTLNYSELWFVEHILNWEKKRGEYLKDKNFNLTEEGYVIKPEIRDKLIEWKTENQDDWLFEYDRIKRKKFFS